MMYRVFFYNVDYKPTLNLFLDPGRKISFWAGPIWIQQGTVGFKVEPNYFFYLTSIYMDSVTDI